MTRQTVYTHSYALRPRQSRDTSTRGHPHAEQTNRRPVAMAGNGVSGARPIASKLTGADRRQADKPGLQHVTQALFVFLLGRYPSAYASPIPYRPHDLRQHARAWRERDRGKLLLRPSSDGRRVAPPRLNRGSVAALADSGGGLPRAVCLIAQVGLRPSPFRARPYRSSRRHRFASRWHPLPRLRIRWPFRPFQFPGRVWGYHR